MENTTPLALRQSDPFNIQAVKRYIFNETGNIMLASTDEKTDTIEQSVRDVFAEVSVFFAAMTKAISQTINPHGQAEKNGERPYYSLYNYDALEAVIDGSGYFVHVNEEDVSYTTNSWGASFSKELIEAVLGLASGSGELNFASAMINSMGKEGASIHKHSSSITSKVANIIFVCEYLLGMPVVSAIIVTADSEEVNQTVSAGPCFSEQSSSTTVTVHKDTYMFITPAFIKQYAGDLSSIMNDPEYLNLIRQLSSLVERIPTVSGVYDVSKKDDPILIPSGKALESDVKYAIYGKYLGVMVAGKSKLSFDPDNSKLKIAPGTWGNNEIEFTVTNTDSKTLESETLWITLKDGSTKISAGSFDIKKKDS